MRDLKSIVARNLDGSGVALTSVCSAHADVLAASLRLADSLDRPILIEATSNQVNQFGGYSGMRPAEFVSYVQALCLTHKVDADRVIFGGDHLGPQVWKDQPAEIAMPFARRLLRDYAAAGFSKIHLDCSEGCAGEAAQVGDELSAKRAAVLARECEHVAPNQCAYVIGTEVPPPGGARMTGHTVSPTSPDNARLTLIAHKEAFDDAGMLDAFKQVCALVVQPGLEFGPDHIDHFDKQQSDLLSAVLQDWPNIAFEAHSTDFQHPEVYPALAARHFAILKVGPALTYAWREALYALAHIAVWCGHDCHVSDVMERLMLNEPGAWQGHHSDNRVLRHFSYADRIRYYWKHPEASSAIAGLIARIDSTPALMPLMQQYLDPDTLTLAETLQQDGIGFARAVLMARVQVMLLPYFQTPA